MRRVSGRWYFQSMTIESNIAFFHQLALYLNTNKLSDIDIRTLPHFGLQNANYHDSRQLSVGVKLLYAVMAITFV